VIHSDEENDEGASRGGGQFACTICRAPFRDAVETLCGHFFCEACALKHFKKSSRCFNCKKQTNGVFKAAEALRTRERERRQDA
jgi:RING finger protein 113A